MTLQSATIAIYSVPFVRSKNPVFEKGPLNIWFTQFLSSYVLGSYTIQFQRLEDLMSVTLPIAYSNFSGNYARIYSATTANGSTTTLSRFFYVAGRHAVASGSVKIDLELDFLNTYDFLGDLSARTYVIREHRNRFLSLAPEYGYEKRYSNIVDYVDEGFKPSLYKVSQEPFAVGDNSFARKSFYLMYRARSNILAGSTQPIGCYLLSDDLIKAFHGTSNPARPIVDADFLQNKIYWFFKRDNPRLVILRTYAPNGETAPSTDTLFGDWAGDTQIAVTLETSTGTDPSNIKVTYKLWTQDQTTGRVSSSVMYSGYDNKGITAAAPYSQTIVATATGCRRTDSEAVLTDGDTISVDEIEEISFTYLGINDGNNQYALNIGGVDRADTRIMKIIKLPYPPVGYTKDDNGCYSFSGFLYDPTVGMFSLVNLSKEFSFDLAPKSVSTGITSLIRVPVLASLYTTPRYVFDPKIYNSSFFYYKLGYDSFSITIPLDLVDIANDIVSESINITFKASNTITTRFLFEWSFNNSVFHEGDDFSRYMIVSRNNEMAIYSSSYLDYLRQGYNYDVKNKNISDISRWVGFGLNTLGAGIQLATGSQFGVSSGITSLSSGLSTAILGQIQSDTKMEETLHNKSLQSASVSGADDSDLLSYYGGNELRLYTYKCRDEIAVSLDTFFYYYGYATNRYEMPNYNSRLNFNYLECAAEFLPTLTLNVSIIEAIKAKLKEGVTIFHYHDEIATKYDIDQQYENFESFFKE